MNKIRIEIRYADWHNAVMTWRYFSIVFLVKKQIIWLNNDWNTNGMETVIKCIVYNINKCLDIYLTSLIRA